jgi:hypothetical protein
MKNEAEEMGYVLTFLFGGFLTYFNIIKWTIKVAVSEKNHYTVILKSF